VIMNADDCRRVFLQGGVDYFPHDGQGMVDRAHRCIAYFNDAPL